MIKNYNSIIGSKILEFDSGQLLAIVEDIIISPDSGMVEAFWVSPLTLHYKHAILLSSCILEFKKNIYVKNDRIFAQADEVIKISEILLEERPFIGNQVKNERGDSYGKCVDLTFDTNTYALRQIYTKKSFFHFITLEERIFSYNNIIRVEKNQILIEDDASSKEKKMMIRSVPEVVG